MSNAEVAQVILDNLADSDFPNVRKLKMSEWMDVTEHRPEHGLIVLAKGICKRWKPSYPSDKFIITAWYCDEETDDEYDNCWYLLALEDFKPIDRKIWKVTHWMPIPEVSEPNEKLSP